ncbi:YqcI/YcgG family protein [Sutcliffiella deserti]|uniref:YqcI/YcgG family protein n=1 Tax=Sutcliffiella deserti TaxID=2875501 RepID=UPI0021E0CE69|nr:YqcI/YcgG family protein [Sutcliffiella deserti]
MKDKERPFPCIPATQGFALNQFRYGFAGDPRSEKSIEELGDLLALYTETAKENGPYTSLLVFFETPLDVKETFSTEQWEQLFWKHLNGLSQIDEIEWPAHIPSDPLHPLWEFCYHGEQYFMYCGTPSHRNRKSRHSEEYVLAITPRWVLEEFGKQGEYARKIKSQVRKRLENYDTIDIHPDLNSYGNPENYEWKQYFLHDDDTSIAKCPFHRTIKSSNRK